MYSINFTQAADDCLNEIASFNTHRLGKEGAWDLADSLVDDIMVTLSEQPLMYPICSQLADYGLGYRERVDDRGFRVIFLVSGDRVNVLLILHQRQSIQDALVRHLLAYR